ncbi:MAG: hypothetical protein MZW92_10155 [Comamonadaceae bacterium]|nr:hypothetical protein [Comamonadaceae bacterium]
MMPDRRPATTVAAADLDYFKADRRDKYVELTGIRQPLVRPRAPAGAFFQYGYFQFGVPVVLDAGLRPDRRPSRAAGRWAARPRARAKPAAGRVRPGRVRRGRRHDRRRFGRPEGCVMPMSRAGAGRLGQSGRGRRRRRGARHRPARLLQVAGRREDRRLRQMDARSSTPTFGEVEIGGFKPYATANPPAAEARRARRRPRQVRRAPACRSSRGSRSASFEAAALGGGLYRHQGRGRERRLLADRAGPGR